MFLNIIKNCKFITSWLFSEEKRHYKLKKGLSVILICLSESVGRGLILSGCDIYWGIVQDRFEVIQGPWIVYLFELPVSRIFQYFSADKKMESTLRSVHVLRQEAGEPGFEGQYIVQYAKQQQI